MPNHIMIQLIPIITAAFKGIPTAMEWLERMSDAIKNGVTEAELLAMVAEAHSSLDELIEISAPDEDLPS